LSPFSRAEYGGQILRQLASSPPSRISLSTNMSLTKRIVTERKVKGERMFLTKGI
jgi:hypothetical protein